jgi:hypothetical protein
VYPPPGVNPAKSIDEVLASQFGGKLDPAANPDPSFIMPDNNGNTFRTKFEDLLATLFFPSGEIVATPTMAYSMLARTVQYSHNPSHRLLKDIVSQGQLVATVHHDSGCTNGPP